MNKIREFFYFALLVISYPFFALSRWFSGDGRKETDCPVCGGTMVEQKRFIPDPYWDIVLECQNCDAYSDGVVIRTDIPREEWAKDE